MEKLPRRRKAAPAASSAPSKAPRAGKPAAKPAAKRAARPTSAKPFPEPVAPRILQLRLTLLGIDPPIWRQILVPDDLTFEDLDDFVRSALDWSFLHAHAFSRVRSDGRLGEEIDESVELREVLRRAKQRVAYEYDFGDGWLHEILVERILTEDPETDYPVCLDGARACPPEDCGGVPGYYALLEALRNPTKANAEQREWLGDYDPEVFSAAAVNQRWAKWRGRG